MTWPARRRLGLAALLLLLARLVQAQSNDVAFHIEAKPLAAALVDLAVQARLSVGHAGVDLHGVAAHAVEGRMTPAQALAALLEGTGFSSVAIDGQTVQIVVAVAARPPILPSTIEDVVVQATKRPAVAQATPASIAVIAGTDLREGGVASADDLNGRVAGLTATNLGAGQDKLFIRGLSDSVLTGRSQAMVGLYLDESRLAEDAPDPGLRLVDIDKVEVLRGPQGALYGDGSLGGVIRVVPIRPQLDHSEAMLSSSLALTAGGTPSYGVDGVVNLPLATDSLGLRLVGYDQKDGGYIDDIRLGRHDVNRTVQQGGRLALTWRPDNDWTLNLLLAGQRIDADDSHYAQLGLATDRRANYLPEPHQDHFLLAAVNAEDRLDGMTIVSNTTFTKRTIDSAYDATLAWPSLTGLPFGPALFGDRRDIDGFSHETRANSNGDGAFGWVGGLSLSYRDENYRSRLDGPGAFGPSVLFRSERRIDRADEGDLFGELTWRPLDWLSMTGGLRLFHAGLNASSVIDLAGQGASPAGGANSANELTRKAVLAIRPAETLLLYASASEGFRLGGININSPAAAVNVNAGGGEQSEVTSASAFASDSLWTYELGSKSSLLDGRLIANVAAFVTLWDNVQSDQILPDGSLYIANVGNVRAPGAEADLDLQLTGRLRLQANLFWNDPKIVHPNPLLIQTTGRLPGVPASSVGATARYEMPLTDDLAGFASLEYAYLGDAHVGFDASLSPTMGDYSIGNLRAGLTAPDWQAVLSLDNIGNSHANSFAYGNPFTFGRIGQVTPLRPFTVGLSLSHRF